MIYHCTKALLEELNTIPVTAYEQRSELFSWNAKVMKVGRRKLVYLMNDASKLSIILYGMTAKEFKEFDNIVSKSLIEVLEDCKVERGVIESYIEDLGSAVFTTIGSRKQIGVLNCAAMESEYSLAGFLEIDLLQRHQCAHMNCGIIKSDKGNYIQPNEVMKNLLEKAYSRGAVDFDLKTIVMHMFTEDRFNMEPYLNIKDGSIIIVEKDTDESGSAELNEDLIYIRHEYYDFFWEFYRFARNIENEDFHSDLDKYGHGNGAIRRIKSLLRNYPDILEEWYAYKSAIENGIARNWLANKGLV
jgi:hypothetical protein